MGEAGRGAQRLRMNRKRQLFRFSGWQFFESIGWKGRLALGFLSWTLFLVGWHLLATSGLANPRLLPPPSEVLSAMGELFFQRDFAADVGVSLRRIFLSFAVAVLVALPIAIVMGVFAFPEQLLNPLVSPFRYLPAPSFVPLLLMWLGTGELQKLALLFLGVIWFLITLLMDNTKGVSRSLIESSQTLGAGRRQVIFQVVFRSALPHYVDTIRQMLAVSWTYLVIAEIVASTDGIGAMMMRAKRMVRVDEIMAGILVIGILGFASDVILRWIRWGCFPYARNGRN